MYSQKSSFLNTFSLTCNTGLGLGGLQKCLCWLTYNIVLGWGGWQEGGKSACFGLLATLCWVGEGGKVLTYNTGAVHKAMAIAPLSFYPEGCLCVERQWSGAQRKLRECSGALRGRSEDAQRTFRGAQRRSEDAHRTLRGRSGALRGRSEDGQRMLRGRSEALKGRSEDP